MRTLRRKLIRQRILPASYERLNYIENTSTAYIDCGLQPKYTFNYEIKAFVFSGNVVLGYQAFDDAHDYRFLWINNNYYFDVGKSRISLFTGVITSRSYYHAKFGNYYIKGIYPLKNETSGPTFDETMYGASIKNLCLFGESPNTSKIGRIYFLKINDGDKCIRYFIPVKRKSDGVIGLYDLIGRKFYTSPNGVAFIGG